jgi:hypothetical protein
MCTPTTPSAGTGRRQFSFQLILDDGALEHLVLPDADAAEVLLRLLQEAETAYFDLEKRIVSLTRMETRS